MNKMKSLSALHLILAILAFVFSAILKGQVLLTTKPEETMEIVMDRIVYEETSQYAMREMFYIDDKPYYLVRLPFTDGQQWAD